MSRLNTLISIDPGISSAYAVLQYGDHTPPSLEKVRQFSGGAEALFRQVEEVLTLFPGADVICEDFTARSLSGFSYRTRDLEPLVCIGGLVSMGVIDRKNRNQMCSPPQQYFLPGSSKAEKKKRQHAWLRENGYAIMPKDLGTKDADDARSATAHAISWLRRQKHEPTLEMFRRSENEA